MVRFTAVGVFTHLGDAELADLADRFGLGSVRASTPIAAGTINSNYALETDTGRWFVRVNEGKSEVDVGWEARLVDALAAAGVTTPPPVHASDGRPYAGLTDVRGKWVSVFPWRAGVHLAPHEVTAASAGAFGGALAALHRAGLALPSAWRRGSIYDHDHLVGRYARFEQSLDPSLARAIDVLGEELAIVGDAADVRGRATFGIIHGDLFRDNVLWADGQLAALLDFEQASGGSLAYDLAVSINDWCWAPSADGPATAPPGPRLDLVAALLQGYGAVRPLSPGDRAALPLEIRAAAMRFTITRITDVYLARVENPDKDFRAFLARTEAWRGGALGGFSSLL